MLISVVLCFMFSMLWLGAWAGSSAGKQPAPDFADPEHEVLARKLNLILNRLEPLYLEFEDRVSWREQGALPGILPPTESADALPTSVLTQGGSE
jgi:hypothetical protein